MRILLVEDEPRLAHSVAKGLRQRAHAVDVSGSAGSARRKFAVEPYDAVILDVNLPDGSGFDLAVEWRTAGSQTPILMLTARDSIVDRVTGLDAGADDYLVKPFAMPEMVARLRALQRRSPEVRPSVIVVGDLTVDPHTRSADRGGRPIELTTTEFALLEFLARSAGKVCGRAEISAHVWDENYDPFSNVIDVYIARLRRRIDLPDRSSLIHTVRGAGYVLDPGRAR